MVDFPRYIENGKVNRVRIATDIAEGKCTQEILSELLRHPAVKDAFFSNIELERKSESEWTKVYLELLKNAVVAENFNEEYLRYLFQVAQYVRQSGPTKPKNKIVWIVGAVLVVLGLTICVNQCGCPEPNGGGDYVQEAR